MSAVQLTRLVEIMQTLRDPVKGCPWDLKQSHESLLPLTVEELAELADAIAKGDRRNTCEELGDVLFHLVFHAQIAQERGDYNMQAVIDTVADKMVRRHPHIFAGVVYANEAEQKADWERIKQEEKAMLPDTYEHLSSLKKVDSLPVLYQSIAMQEQLAKMGFDWADAEEVVPKIVEELDEVRTEIQTGNNDAMAEEFGDLLFAVLNFGRKLNIDPEMALRKANHKFYSRSEFMIEVCGGLEAFESLSLDEKALLWNAAKRGE